MNIKTIIASILFAVLIIPTNFFSYAITVHSQALPTQAVPTTAEEVEALQQTIQQQRDSVITSTQEEVRERNYVGRVDVVNARIQEKAKEDQTPSQSKITQGSVRPVLGPVSLPDPAKPKTKPQEKKTDSSRSSNKKSSSNDDDDDKNKIIRRTPGSVEYDIGRIVQSDQAKASSGTTRDQAILDALQEGEQSDSNFFEDLATSAAAGIVACLAAAQIGKLISKIRGGVSSATSVPTADAGANASLSNVSGSASGGQAKECTLDSIAFTIKEEVKAFIIQDLLLWINSGFEGKPLFVSNPKRFFGAISDRVAGQAIENSALGFLCSPFDVSFDLALKLPSAYAGGDSKSCTFSDVGDNVDNAARGLKKSVRKSAADLSSLLKRPTINPRNVPVEDLAKHLSNPLNDYQTALTIASSEIEAEQARLEAETKEKVSEGGTLGAPNPDCASKLRAEKKSHLIPTVCADVQSGDYVANVEKAVLENELSAINFSDEIGEVLVYAAQQAAKKFIASELAQTGSGRSPDTLSSGVAAVTAGANTLIDEIQQSVDSIIRIGEAGSELIDGYLNAAPGQRLELELDELNSIKDRTNGEQKLTDTINTFVVEVVTPLSHSAQDAERNAFPATATTLFAEEAINSFLSSLPTEDILLTQYGTSDYCTEAPDDIECVTRDNIVGILTDLHQTIANREIIKVFSNDPETGFRISEDVVQLDISNFSSKIFSRRNKIIESIETFSLNIESDANLITTTKPLIADLFFTRGQSGPSKAKKLLGSEHFPLYSDSSIGTINCPIYGGDVALDIFPLVFQTKIIEEEIPAIEGYIDFDITIGKQYYRTECTIRDIVERENVAKDTFFFESGQNILDATNTGSATSAGSLRYNYNHITNFLKNIDNYYR